ncbi:GpE family phage tail protein [Ottowia sp. SB7-C50]|nr:GpE family phage tail protein [Ottowia sp. SB7-C50]WOP14680.1 GpE family phage tail protein [Ottowia sp. SB7-C50]
MADIAIAFHWRPADMDGMHLAELMDWRELARARLEPEA